MMTARPARPTAFVDPNRLVVIAATGGLAALASLGTALLVLTSTSVVAPSRTPVPPLPASSPLAKAPGVVVLPPAPSRPGAPSATAHRPALTGQNVPAEPRRPVALAFADPARPVLVGRVPPTVPGVLPVPPAVAPVAPVSLVPPPVPPVPPALPVPPLPPATAGGGVPVVPELPTAAVPASVVVGDDDDAHDQPASRLVRESSPPRTEAGDGDGEQQAAGPNEDHDDHKAKKDKKAKKKDKKQDRRDGERAEHER